MTRIYSGPLYEVTTDGKTLWVNGPVLLGRFSPLGVDVHVDCQCVAGSCGPEPDWDRFVELMKEHHDIDVSRFRAHLTWMQ